MRLVVGSLAGCHFFSMRLVVGSHAGCRFFSMRLVVGSLAGCHFFSVRLVVGSHAGCHFIVFTGPGVPTAYTDRVLSVRVIPLCISSADRALLQ